MKIAKSLINRYRAYKGAEEEITVIIIRIEDHWIKVERQFEFLEDIWHTLDETLQDHYSTLLKKLEVQMLGAKALLDSIEPSLPDDSSLTVTFANPRRSKLKYALSLKGCLEQSLRDLQMWRDMFDPSWFLMILVSRNTIMDQYLQDHKGGDERGVSIDTFRAVRDAVRDAVNPGVVGMSNNWSIFLPTSYLGRRKENLGGSSLQIVERREDGYDVLMDIVYVRDKESFDDKREDVRNLARVLFHVSPITFGLLKCEGVVIVKKTENEMGSFKFVFDFPTGLKNPRSLRTILTENTRPRSLNEKLDIAHCLANSVLYVHTANYVHKNIRPDTIVVFETDDETKPVASFLVGFENFRPAKAQTWLLSDLLWEKDLYRHPQRQGVRPQEKYAMQHDIYSLGVCLLEIGVWTSFVTRTESLNPPIPCPEIGIDRFLTQRNHEKIASDVKCRLIDMAKELLPGKMGNKYTNVVISCLKCLDREGNKFGDSSEFHDADGILVGVRFIEAILLQIQEISV
ncbi:hypothetical protein MMC07_003607 [Pseudocyphellaria aurata]|nr:hypothetical protein [Pseudocyphellaria aurata]